MFPGGSPELVEPIYKNPKLSAPFNEQLAAAIRAYAEDRLQVACSGSISGCLRSLKDHALLQAFAAHACAW
jgi:hypothetical protein